MPAPPATSTVQPGIRPEYSPASIGAAMAAPSRSAIRNTYSTLYPWEATMMAGMATITVTARASDSSASRLTPTPARSAAMPLARPFISVSSVLMASIRAQMSIRKCIHRGNRSVASANSAAATWGYWNGATEPLPTAAMPAMPITKVRGMATAAAPHRLRFRARGLSTV